MQPASASLVPGPRVAPARAPVQLAVSGLRVRFGRLTALDGVDLTVRAGEVVALAGENGAGKSTLIRCIAGDIAPTSGVIALDGRPVPPDTLGAKRQGVSVVWQDLALCDNLSAVANVFLGHERVGAGLLDESTMAAETCFERLHINVPQPLLPVRTLSGGQRQLVAIARAVLRSPSVLILDEPTASLGVTETQVVERLLSQLRASGTAILLVSHRLEQVFNLADRIAVLRDGRIVANVSPLEVHPDDVVAMISGVQADSTARRQLRRLRSLVDQLSEVEPSASLPLIVSAMAEALGIHQLCVHLLDQPDEEGRVRLRRSAAVGLVGPFLDQLALLPIGASGGPPGIAAATGEVVVVEDVRRDRRWQPPPPIPDAPASNRDPPVTSRPLGLGRRRRCLQQSPDLVVGAHPRFVRRPRDHLRLRRHRGPAPSRPVGAGVAVRQPRGGGDRTGAPPDRRHQTQPGARNAAGRRSTRWRDHSPRPAAWRWRCWRCAGASGRAHHLSRRHRPTHFGGHRSCSGRWRAPRPRLSSGPPPDGPGQPGARTNGRGRSAGRCWRFPSTHPTGGPSSPRRGPIPASVPMMP